ncbi:MAG: energy-coupling factor ABC transporter ATP-binding protein [Treponema sp.]|nr:energy-coupling factor ABC transporter ATP-binding protein [Treponema sp.]
MAFIKLENICYEYEDSTALKDISLEIQKGECIGFEGDNGSGKTTLIKLLNGLIFASSGKFIFEDKEINKNTMKKELFAKEFHQKIGYVFQNPENQLFCGSVGEEIAFGPRQMGLSEEEVKARTSDVMKMLGIEQLENRAPYHLSGGEKKKTALACVLSMNPEVLVLDEPMNGLDRKSREKLLQILLSLKAAGKTLIIATHDEVLLNQLSDRIITITEEHTLEQGA